MKSTMRKTMIASSVTLALGASVATNAELVTNLGGTPSTVSGNFTMLNATGLTIGPDGGTNDVNMAWNGTGYNSSSDYTGPGLPGSAANVTASSTDPFFGAVWTAHDIQVFVPGSYSFDTAQGGGNAESGILNVTVPAGRLGIHMLFDWNGNNNIDVFVVAAPSSVFGAGIGRGTQNTASGSNLCDISIANCLFDGKPFGTAKPVGSQIWMLASVDGDGDGVMGIPMAAGGPFQFFSANFNMDLAVTNFPPTAGNFSTSATANVANVINLLQAGRATDADGTVDPTSIVIVSGPSNGGIVVNNDGTVTYTPNAAYTGPDQFTYTVLDNDGSISNVGTASITVTASANTPPVANDTTFTSNEDQALNIPVTAVATDANGDPLTFSTFDALSAQTGAVSVDGSNTTLTYTPLANFNGTDSFSFVVTDGVDSSSPATVTVIVNAVNDAPVCTNVTLNTGVDTPLDINVANTLLSTCSDVDGDPITLGTTTPPTQGGTLGSDGANTLTYTPATAFSGQDTFTYTATDGAATDTRTVAVNVGKVFGNFTMLDGDGGTFGGTNDIVFTWDGTCYNSVAEANAGPSNMTMGSDSTWLFFGFPWFAHDIKVYCAGGPYTIDTCNAGSAPPDCGPLTFTVPAGHLGGHLLFDWNATTDIDVVNIWNNSTGGTWQNVVPAGQLFQGATGPTPSLDQFFDWISTDGDGDGVPGIQFNDGPFINFRANFNFKTTQTGGGGPVVAPVSSVPSPNLGSTGCTIAVAPVSPLTKSDWLGVAGFLAWIGIGARMRRLRQRGKKRLI